MISDKETNQSLNTSTHSIYFGSNWMCLKRVNGIALLIPREIRKQSRENVFKFLPGLDKSLNEVRGRIMGFKPFPTLREAFSEVRREESRKKVMLGHTESITPGSSESSALAVSRPPDQRRKRPWCDHCKKAGHTKENCWVLHGKPCDYRQGRTPPQSKDAMVAKKAEDPFTKEQILNKQSENSTSSQSQSVNQSSLTQIGNESFILLSHSELKGSWIIDSGASDHMIGAKELLKDFQVLHTEMAVRTTDGRLSQVQGKGTCPVSSQVKLENVLFVPHLQFNLLSVSKLCRTLNCHAKFTFYSCVFQEQG